jgi:hypothetical protein
LACGKLSPDRSIRVAFDFASLDFASLDFESLDFESLDFEACLHACPMLRAVPQSVAFSWNT